MRLGFDLDVEVVAQELQLVLGDDVLGVEGSATRKVSMLRVGTMPSFSMMARSNLALWATMTAEGSSRRVLIGA